MRTAFLAVLVALAMGGTARAGRINITAAAATYWTATDELEIQVWFDSPLVAPPDYFAFGGGINGEGRAGESFYFRSDGRVGRDIMEPFYVAHLEYDELGRIVDNTAMGLPEVTIQGRIFAATMPLAMTGLDRPEFIFGATVIRDGKSHYLEGSSATDERIVYTPEPSSATLASLGVVVMLVHLARRPRLRHCRSERH